MASGPGTREALFSLGKSLEDILLQIENLTAQFDHDDESRDEHEFESCFRIRGRPILPPLMTKGTFLRAVF
jgi:hypothetical protein